MMKKIYAVLIIICLVITFTPLYLVGVEADEPESSVFGYTENGISTTNIEYRIAGVWGEATGGDGTADYIMALFTAVNGYGTYVGDVTAGLYEYVDSSSVFAGSLIAQTEVKQITVVDGSTEWVRFNFTGEKPLIVNNTRYYCVVSADVSSASLQLTSTYGGGYGMYKVVEYDDTLPSTLQGEIASEYRRCIYCSYTVIPENYPPVISNIPDQTILEGESFTVFDLDDYVSDLDNPDNELNWAYSGNDDLVVNINSNHVCTVSIPDINWNGVETITFSVTDPEGAGDQDDALFRVNAVNDPPIITNIPDQTILEGESFATFDLDNYVHDVDNPDNELSWVYSGNVDFVVNINSNHVCTVSVPYPDWNGAETITFSVTDPQGAGDQDEATFTVTVVNTPPDISNPFPTDGATDVSIYLSQLNFYLSDSDGDRMDYTVETSPDIGDQTGFDVSEGTIVVDVSGLLYDTTYVWYVSVTDPDGSGSWTNEIYSFTTESEPQNVETYTFGYTENGVSTTNIEYRIAGVWGEATGGDGTAECIMARLKAANGYGTYVGDITAGLYTYVDSNSVFAGTLIAQTEVKQVTILEGATEWIRFNFTGEKPLIVNNTKYYCMVSADVSSAVLQLMSTYGGGYGMYKVVEYDDTLPSTLQGEIASGYRRCIYCSYSVIPENAPPVVSNPNPVDGATDVTLNPMLSINIMDAQGDTVQVTFMSNASGSWQQIGGTQSGGNGLYTQETMGMDSYDTTYFWSVHVTDPFGSDRWTNRTFSFTTIESEWWDTNWAYRKELTIDHTKVAGNLLNFPVLVKFDSDSDLAVHAQSDGDDFVFVDYYGERLDHEIERFDDDSGQLIAWVKVPDLSLSLDTIFYLYYGNSLCGNQENGEGVWDAGYLAVHHFNEVSGEHFDSTMYHNDSTAVVVSSQGVLGGIAGGCDVLDGSDDFIQFPNKKFAAGSDEITVEMWINPDDTNAARTIYDEYNADVYWQYSLRFDKFYTRDASGGPTETRDNDVTWTDPTIGSWHHVVCWYSVLHGEKRIYLDGLVDSSTSVNVGRLTSERDSSSPRLGYACDGTNFDGKVDEFRVSQVARSTEWLETTYNTIMTPDTFVSIGSEETCMPSEKPVISLENPTDGATDVSISLSELSFYISDPDGDLMDYSVWTSPDIGDQTGFNVGDGFVVVDVSGLTYDTTYVWYVSVTDPEGSGSWTHEMFSFTTESEPVNTNHSTLQIFSICYTTSINQPQIQQFIAEHFDLLDCGRSMVDAAASIKALNPNIKILGYYDSFIMSPHYGDWPYVNQFEEWFVHDQSGNRVKLYGHNLYLMNPAPNLTPNDPYHSWSDYYAIKSQQFLQNYNQYNGIFVDDCAYDLQEAGYSFNVPFSDFEDGILDNWGPWMMQHIQNLQTHIGDNMAMPNAWKYTQYCEQITGVHSWENFVHGRAHDVTHPGYNEWYTMYAVDKLHEQAENGHTIAVICGSKNADSNPPLAHQYMLFSMICFLFAVEDMDTSYYAWNFFEEDASNGYYPEMDYEFGEPTGDYYFVEESVYAREFENATVVANISPSIVHTVNINGTNYQIGTRTGIIIPAQ